MKKSFILIFFLFGLFLISSCKTPPVEQQKISINQQLYSTYSIEDFSNKKIKIYFPSFMIYDASQETERMVWGDGMVIILPDEKVMMIDSFDSEGQEQLIDFLKDLSITKIDYFFATHNHMDHIGGVPAILDTFPVDHYYWNGAHFDSAIDQLATQKLEEKQIETTILKQGDSLILCKEPLCKIDVLWPHLSEKDIYNIFYKPGRTAKMKNNSSLVLKLTYGNFSVLFTGDLYKQGENELVKTYGSELKSTILKSPHHGEFYTANGKYFIKTVSPEVTIIQDSIYVVLPISNKVINKLYSDINSKLLYRYSEGYILITSNGSEYSVKESSFTK